MSATILIGAGISASAFSHQFNGDVEIYELDANSKVADRIGYAKGIALYDPTLARLVSIPVNPEMLTAGKKLLLRFDEKGKYGGNNLVEQVFTVQP